MIGDLIKLDGAPYEVTFEALVDYGPDACSFTVVRAAPVSAEDQPADGAGPRE